MPSGKRFLVAGLTLGALLCSLLPMSREGGAPGFVRLTGELAEQGTVLAVLFVLALLLMVGTVAVILAGRSSVSYLLTACMLVVGGGGAVMLSLTQSGFSLSGIGGWFLLAFSLAAVVLSMIFTFTEEDEIMGEEDEEDPKQVLWMAPSVPAPRPYDVRQTRQPAARRQTRRDLDYVRTLRGTGEQDRAAQQEPLPVFRFQSQRGPGAVMPAYVPQPAAMSQSRQMPVMRQPAAMSQSRQMPVMRQPVAMSQSRQMPDKRQPGIGVCAPTGGLVRDTRLPYSVRLPDGRVIAAGTTPNGKVELGFGMLAGVPVQIGNMESYLIGRDTRSCNLVVEGSAISRRHCLVTYDARKNAYLVRDLSSNGTFTENGSRMKPGCDVEVQAGSRVYLALPKYRVRMG